MVARPYAMLDDFTARDVQVGETVNFVPADPDPSDEPLDAVPFPGAGNHWRPARWAGSVVLSDTKPTSRCLWFKWSKGMFLMRGEHPVDPSGNIARTLRNRPVSDEVFPGPPPEVVRRWDGELGRLVSLLEAIEAHSNAPSFDRSILAREWLTLSQAPPPAPPPPPPPLAPPAQQPSAEPQMPQSSLPKKLQMLQKLPLKTTRKTRPCGISKSTKTLRPVVGSSGHGMRIRTLLTTLPPPHPTPSIQTD